MTDTIMGIPVVHTDYKQISGDVVLGDFTKYIAVKLSVDGREVFNGGLDDMLALFSDEAAKQIKEALAADIDKAMQEEISVLLNGTGEGNPVGILKVKSTKKKKQN